MAARLFTVRDAIFLLGLCGLGLKAGMMSLHIWLPGAHANAQSYPRSCRALIKMGITDLSADAVVLRPSVGVHHGGCNFRVFGCFLRLGSDLSDCLLSLRENIGIICPGSE
jgi:hypothetical protein